MPRPSASLLAARWAALAVLVAGCHGGSTGGGIGVPDDRPSPYLGDDPTPPQPALDAATFSAATAKAFALTRSVDVPVIVDLYESLVAKADGSCPNLQTDDNGDTVETSWDGDCTTAAGVRFSGYGSITHYKGATPDDGVTRDGVDGYMDAVLVDTDGTSLDIGLYLADYVDHKDGETDYSRSLQGTAYATGPGAPDSPWLHGDLKGQIDIGYSVYDDGSRGVYLNGALSGIDGPVHTASFADLYAGFSADGPDCADPTGTLSLRQDGGGWYDVIFDAYDPKTDDTDQAKCDGCGPTFFGGEKVDTMCIDVKPLGDFQGAPW